MFPTEYKIQIYDYTILVDKNVNNYLRWNIRYVWDFKRIIIG
jgi:hypothetical protein